jgi:hypothetical protein
MKAIGFYLSGPVPLELQELEENVGRLDPVGRSLLNEFVTTSGACEIYTNHQNACKRLAELTGPESGERLFESMQENPSLKPILTLNMPALRWVELQGWTRELLYESIRTSVTQVVATK